jgi:transcriptional regulator with XRE-family HTH domain
MPSAVDRVRFSHFVERALASARARGMSAVQIEEATQIRLSTIHRWRRGEIAPTVDKVRQFCAGLGISPREALAALGVGAREATAEPPMDPDVLKLLRLLADPKTPEPTKDQIRAMMRVLAALADTPPAKKAAKPRKAAG